MKTYKAPDNSLHCIDPAFEYLLPAGCVEVTDEEAEAIRIANEALVEPVAPVDPVTKLKDFLAVNPDVAALLSA